MNLKNSLLSGLMLLASATAGAQSIVPLSLPSGTIEGFLPNGLHYIIKQNDLPRHNVECRLVMNVGAINETDKQRGVAHFLEHMAFKGSEHFPNRSVIDYFERQGVNVLVFSNSFNGGFNDETNSGIEIIHHGVRTVQGGAVRLNNTHEQWDLVPMMTDRKVDREKGIIEVSLRYNDYDFNSRIVVTGKGKAVEIAVWLDKPVPEKLAGEAGLNIEFLPSQ